MGYLPNELLEMGFCTMASATMLSECNASIIVPAKGLPAVFIMIVPGLLCLLMLSAGGAKPEVPVSVSVFAASRLAKHPAASVCGIGMSRLLQVSVLPLPFMLMLMLVARASGKNMAGESAAGVNGNDSRCTITPPPSLPAMVTSVHTSQAVALSDFESKYEATLHGMPRSSVMPPRMSVLPLVMAWRWVTDVPTHCRHRCTTSASSVRVFCTYCKAAVRKPLSSGSDDDGAFTATHLPSRREAKSVVDDATCHLHSARRAIVAASYCTIGAFTTRV